MSRIYLIGKCGDYNRTSSVIKLLLDWRHDIYYEGSISCYTIERRLRLSGVKKLLFDIVEEVVRLPVKVYSLLFADLVFVTAMNQAYRKQVELKLAKWMGKRVILDYYMSFYDSLVLDNKIVEPNTKLSKKLKRVEFYALTAPDKIIFLNMAEANRYSQISGVKLRTIDYTILPLCVPERKNAKLKYFRKRSDTINLCWWGTYIALHGLEKIIEMACVLKKRSVKFRLYVLGNSHVASLPYRELVDKLGCSDVVSVSNNYTFANGRLDGFLHENCDLVLGNFGDSDKSKSVIVNKLVEGLTMRAPILNGESIATDDYFNYQDDIWKSDNEPEAMADVVMTIMKCSLKDVESRVENGYEIYQRHFSLESFAVGLKDALGENYDQ